MQPMNPQKVLAGWGTVANVLTPRHRPAMSSFSAELAIPRNRTALQGVAGALLVLRRLCPALTLAGMLYMRHSPRRRTMTDTRSSPSTPAKPAVVIATKQAPPSPLSLSSLVEGAEAAAIQACAAMAERFLVKDSGFTQKTNAVHGAFNESATSRVVGTEHSQRQFLKPGSWYQNPHMTLWNDSGAPVSSILHITAEDGCELKVENLDSRNCGSKGWIIFRSAFDVQSVPGQPNRVRLALRCDRKACTLEYDEELFERGANFALSCLKRCTWALLGAFSIEVDIERDVVFCGSRAGVLQNFWETSVGLELTSEKNLWKFEPSRDVTPRSSFSGPVGVLAVA